MANKKHLKILKQGVEAWNKWRRENRGVDPDLRRADLTKEYLGLADLSITDLSLATLNQSILNGAILFAAKLGGATLRDADLSNANLAFAHCTDTDLRGANLSWAQLHHAFLDNAQLAGVDLSFANLSEAELDGVDIGGSLLCGTVLADVNLSSVKRLESCIHLSPSTIDHRTIERSGMLPVEFLRGCGLPDSLINFLPSLLSQEYYSCFISYSTDDKEFVNKLYADLQDSGVRCWYDVHTMQSGKKMHEQIREAIQHHDRLLLVLSENSMQSEWVKTEIANARTREVKEGRQILFPIRLVGMDTIKAWECFDADTGKDSAREIREYFLLDFQNWKDEKAYKESLDRLLRDLTATASGGA